MRLAVISHKLCWRSPASPSGYATDGGFALQMGALSELFDSTRLVVPCDTVGVRPGEVPISGRNLVVVPLSTLTASDLARKLRFPGWALRNVGTVAREIVNADAAHTPIPGDVGTIGMLLGLLWRKRLFVRHCGNWFVQQTAAERFWIWIMQRAAGGRNVMLATGGAASSPVTRNPALQWIFSTTVTERELQMLDVPRTAPARGAARLIIVCRQDAAKGTGVVIESLPAIQAAVGEVTLDVVGDGPDLASFKALAARCGVAPRVRFHGKRDHQAVLDLLQQADLFCYPTSASEGFPKVVLEALACGLPVVSTPVSVLPELLRSGCGRLIDRPTPPHVAAAIIECVSDSREYLRMSQCARQTARAYSLERWRDTLRDLLTAAWGPLNSHA